MSNKNRTECHRKDCQLNEKGYCFPIVKEAKTKYGETHILDLDECPFYKQRKKREET